MLIKNINQVLVDYAGNALKQPTGEVDEKKKPITENLTLKGILVHSALYEDQQSKFKPKERMLRYHLGKKIHDAKKELELTAEEIAMLKAGVHESFVIIISAQVCEILESLEEKQKGKKDGGTNK